MRYQKIGVIFPGQGSQYVGMGKELYDRFKLVRDVYDESGSVVGYDMAEKCFKKPLLGSKLVHRPDLDRTKFTQPAVFTTAYACYKIFEEMCKELNVQCNIAFLAGHSLGEYTALAVAGAMDFKICMDLVQKRADFITEFSDAYPDAGLMAVVNRGKEINYAMIEDLTKEAQVYVTLVNTRSQIVVGGFRKNLDDLGKKLKKEGLIPTILKVEGPFHSPLMKPAADRFKRDLNKSQVFIANKPVIANVTSEAIVDPGHIKKELYEQIFTCVNWRSSIEKMVENGADLFIEVGPKKVLSNMLKDIHPETPTMNVEDMESLEKTVKELGAQEG
ncbi:MAG: ACP S-malonyltransferase [Deltaproteobacteria bacterium]|nr:ACP S-malonyltransferase [Deltaproteobacteria bacterium]